MKNNKVRFWEIFIWSLKEWYELSPINFWISVCTSIAVSLLPILYNYVFAGFVDSLAQKEQKAIYYSVLILVCVYFIQAIIGGLNRSKRRELKFLVKYRFSNKINIGITKFSPDAFELTKAYDQVLNAIENSDRLTEFVDLLLDVVKSGFSIIALFLIVYKISPFMPFILIVVALPGSIKEFMLTKQYWLLYKKNLESKYVFKRLKGRIEYTKFSISYLISGSYSYLIDKLKFYSNLLLNTELGLIKKDYLISIFSNFVLALAQLALPLLFIEKIVEGVWSIGDYTFRMSSLTNYVESVEHFLGNIANFYDNIISLGMVMDFFEQVKIEQKANSLGGKIKMSLKPLKSPDISVQNLTFKYPNSNNKVLDGINLEIKSGEKIAIVGDNGSGKTTLLYILLGVYKYYDGDIKINGVSLGDIDKEDYWNSISYMPQDYPGYYELDVKTNVAIGNPSLLDLIEKGDLAIIRKALNEAESTDFVNKLPNKENTKLMKKFKEGVSLSGGQWQRLALARFFAREASFYVLDEPTSTLDISTEKKIFERIFSKFAGKTAIIVSHKFSTIKKANKIVVLDNGRIVEQGSHKQLMDLGGKYKKKFDLQVKMFD